MIAALDAKGVSHRYGNVIALQDVNVAVQPGEFVVLLGPNGAGKTTLFNVLTGLYSPDAGSVRLAGNDIRAEAQQALASSGVVFQQPSIDLDMSLQGNLCFHARLHGMPRRLREERVAQALEQLGLQSRAHEPVRVLSGGNRRRAELARALLHAPALLLMDEPSVGLDPANRKQLLDEVRALCAASGTGVFWATHLVDEAEYADRVVILHRGQVIADLPPRELLQRQNVADISAAFIAMTDGNAPQHERAP